MQIDNQIKFVCDDVKLVILKKSKYRVELAKILMCILKSKYYYVINIYKCLYINILGYKYIF